MLVIADATPLNYLILLHRADLLPQLFGSIVIPEAVFRELHDPAAPQDVQNWITRAPAWLEVRNVNSAPDVSLNHLDAGECEAIALAEELHADLLLLDDSEARREAARRGLGFLGTLGILREAARRDMVDLRVVLAQLQETSFYVSPSLLQSLLDEDAQRKRSI